MKLKAAVGCLLLALLATFPLVSTPLGRLVGHPDVDVTNHAWGPWWWWITLGRGEIPWSTPLLAAPEGGVLWFIDPFLAAVGALGVGVVGVVGAYNLVVLLYVGLAAASGRALARALGAGEGAAWVAAAAVATSPYLLSEVHNGVTEAVGVCWSTFALAAARRALDVPVGAAAPGHTTGGAALRGGMPSAARRGLIASAALRAWAVTGLWLGAAAAGTWYYGLATGLTIGAWALLAALGPGAAGGAPRGWSGAHLRAHVGGAALAGAIGVVVAAPVLALVRRSIGDPRSIVVRGDVDAAVREFLLAHNAVDPRAFVAPFGFQSVDLAARGEAFLHSSYLGLVALALVGVALRHDRARWRILAGVVPAAVLSLGAYLWWAEAWVTVGGARLALPFAWLVKLLPDAGSTHAQRLVWPVIATVAALAAVGVDRLVAARPAEARRRWLVGLGLAVTLDLLASGPWPLARVEPLDLRAHAALKVKAWEAARKSAAWKEGDPGPRPPEARGVLDLPTEVGNTMATSRYLVYQTASELPIPYRPDARGGTASVFGEPWFHVLFLASAARADQAARLDASVLGGGRVDIGSFEKSGIRWVVLHRELERGRGDIAALEAQLRAWFGAPEELGTHLTWDVTNRRDDGGDVLIAR